MELVKRNAPGKGRKMRVGVSLETEYDNKLNRLAIACGYMAPTTLAYLLITRCLDNPKMISDLQDEYATTPDYRVIVVNGKMEVLR